MQIRVYFFSPLYVISMLVGIQVLVLYVISMLVGICGYFWVKFKLWRFLLSLSGCKLEQLY